MRANLEKKLFKACLILFGSRVDISRDFLNYIQTAGVKRAYRRMAMLTHPDMNVGVDSESRGRKTRSFIETNWAYENLLDFIKKRDNGGVSFQKRASRPVYRPVHRPRKRPARRAAERKPPERTGYYYSSHIPRHRLLFGQYLFFSGSVSWEALVKAIVWQRRQRPRLGEIAKKEGWLSDAQIRRLVAGRKYGEPLGETAVRLRYLKRTQLNTLLRSQWHSQKLFGEYFVLHNHMSGVGLKGLYMEFIKHNSRYRRFSWEKNDSF
jgi:hypothetical protein